VDSPDGNIGTLEAGDPATPPRAEPPRRTPIFNSNQSAGATGTFDLPAATLFGVHHPQRHGRPALAGQRSRCSPSSMPTRPIDLMRQYRDNVFGFETGGDANFKDVLISFQFSAPRQP
jgi:hypothetical protein